MNAWESSSGDENAGRRSERLLDLLEEKSDAGDNDMAPNFNSYNKVIGTWSKSSSPNKVDRALAVLERMRRRKEEGKLNGRVPEYSYALVINTCAFCSLKDPAEELRIFRIAENLFNHLLRESEENGGKTEPSPTTYGWYIQAVGRLGIPDKLKRDTLEQTIKRCCKKGRVNPFVWERIKSATTHTQFMQLMEPVFSRLNRNGNESSSAPSDVNGQTGVRLIVKYSQLPKEWVWKGYPAADTNGKTGISYPRGKQSVDNRFR